MEMKLLTNIIYIYLISDPTHVFQLNNLLAKLKKFFTLLKAKFIKSAELN